MRDLNVSEVAEVSGSVGFLVVGLTIIGYTAAFAAGGPAGLGIAVAATVAEQGAEKLDVLINHGKVT